LPPHNALDPDSIPKKRKIYLQQNQKFREVKEKLVRCLNKEKQDGEP
jgi:hypothetical protein